MSSFTVLQQQLQHLLSKFTHVKATCSIQGSKHWLLQSLTHSLSVQLQRLVTLKLLYPHLQHFAALGLCVTTNNSVWYSSC